MTPQQIVGLGIRLLALWIAFHAIPYFSFKPFPIFSPDVSYQKWTAYLIGVAALAVAVLLWLFPMWIAHKLLPRTQFENKLEIRSLEAARVGCGLIGLWVLAQALPSMAWYLFRAFLIVGNDSLFSALNADAKLDMATSIVEMVFSLFLIVRSDVFARLLIRDNPLEQKNTDNVLQKTD
jgi:ABC-type multidrug transport system fused ATPase/permease subunit